MINKIITNQRYIKKIFNIIIIRFLQFKNILRIICVCSVFNIVLSPVSNLRGQHMSIPAYIVSILQVRIVLQLYAA